MSIEHVLMFALVVFVFYHFMYRCNRVEGLSECEAELQFLCGRQNYAKRDSCKEGACDECIHNNWNALEDKGCSKKTVDEFCPLPEQHNGYLIKGGELKDDGKAKLMEVLGKYRSSLMKGLPKKLDIHFGICHTCDGYDNINISNLIIQLEGGPFDRVNIYGDIPELDGTFSFVYQAKMPDPKTPRENYQYISMDIIAQGEEYNEIVSINLSDNPSIPDDYTKEYNIGFSYYLC